MAKKDHTFGNPHVLPYSIALAVIVLLPVITILLATFINGYTDRAYEDNVYILMLIVVFPGSFAYDYVASAKRTHRILPFLAVEKTRELFSQSLFMGVLFALIMMDGVVGLWPILTQFIGSMVICTAAAFIYISIWNWGWARLKAMWTNT